MKEILEKATGITLIIGDDPYFPEFSTGYKPEDIASYEDEEDEEVTTEAESEPKRAVETPNASNPLDSSQDNTTALTFAPIVVFIIETPTVPADTPK